MTNFSASEVATTVAAPAPLEIIDPVRWQGQPVPERRWLAEGLLPFGSVTMLNGDGGVGKSLLTQQLLTSAALGHHWLGYPVAQVKAIGLYCEDDEAELHVRQDAINRGYDCDYADLEHLYYVNGVGIDPTLMEFERFDHHGRATAFYQQISALAAHFGAQLIVLDSLHDLFAGDENARPQARQFINLLRGLAIAQDAVVVVNAHPSLAGMKTGSGFSGSTSWNNAVRSRLYLRRPKKDEADYSEEDIRILNSMKSNYSRVGTELKLRWHRGMFVPLDDNGGVLSTNERENAERVFMTLLSKREAQGRPVSPRPRADNYAPRAFARLYDCSGFSKRDLEAAMERLFEKGNIRVARYGERPSRMFEKIESDLTVNEG